MLKRDVDDRYKEIFEENCTFDDASPVILYSKLKNGTSYFNCKTGKKSFDLNEICNPNENRILLKKNYRLKLGYHIEYNEKFDVIILSTCSFMCSGIKEGETRNWNMTRNYEHYDYKFVITRDCECYYPSWEMGYNYTTFFSPTMFNHCINICGNSLNNSVVESKQQILTLKNYFGTGICWGTLYPQSFKNTNGIQALFETKIPCVAKNKQEIINSFTKYKLSDFSERTNNRILNFVKKVHNVREGEFSLNNVINNRLSYELYDGIRFSVIEKVKKGLCVIRFFQAYVDISKLDNNAIFSKFEEIEFFEYSRVYVTKNESFSCKNIAGKWYYLKKGIYNYNFSSIIISWDKRSTVGTKLEFFDSLRIKNNEMVKKSLQEPITDKKRWYEYSFCQNYKLSSQLHALLESNVLESFLKSDYPNLQKYFNLGHHYDLSSDYFLVNMFGKINKNKTSLVQAIGCPSYMLQVIDQYENTHENLNDAQKYAIYHSISLMKKIFSSYPKYFLRMDKETFKRVLEMLVEFRIDTNRFYLTKENILKQLVSMYGPNKIVKYAEYIYINFPELNTTNYLYSDYLRMANAIKERVPLGNWKLKSYDDVITAHTQMIELYNSLKDGISYDKTREQFEKQRKKWDKYAYSENEFSVIIPEKAEEIANEGITLKHCVKSYINAVASGQTKIFFIRRTNDINTPFFTLEIRSNKVRQCHGFSNCNVSTVKGLESFLERYCENIGVVYSEGKKVLAV